MAVIDSKKLLPPSKSSGSALTTQKFLVPISNIKVKSSAIIKSSDITPEIKEGGDNKKTLLGEIVHIRKNAISIQKIIGDNNAIFKKAEEQKRKLLEKEKFAKKEKQLETKDTKQKISLPTPSLPRTGFLDAIKRFLFFTLLGAAFVKFGKYIPKILEFSKKLIPAFKFLEDFAGNLLNGVVDFVGAGYKAYDKVREITKQIGGENLQSKFDEFSKQFNTFANLALIAGMSTMGGTDFGGKPSAAKPGIDRVRGGRVDKATQSRYLSRYGKGAFTNRFGQQSLKGLTGKGVGRLAGKALGRIPIIGGLVDFIISTVIFKEKPGRAAAKAIGATIGSALGTFIPIPFAGTILGGIVGDLVGGALYDSLVGNDTLKAKAQGGQVTRGGQRSSVSSRRTIKSVKKKPPKVKPQKTIPGKDVGGKEEIKKLFPSPANLNQRNPLGVLETTSKNLKEIPLFGGIMGASVDLTMGQKPDASVFRKIGNGFGMLIQSAIDAETSNTIGNIQKEIVGLASGGVVPRTLSTSENIGMKIGERLAKTIEVMMNSKVNETLQSIRQQFTKEGFGLVDNGVEGPVTGEIAAGTVARGQISIEQLVGLAKGAGFNDSDAVIMAAIAMAESGGNSNAHNNKPPDNSYGLWQINMIGDLGPERRKQFGISNNEQLKDPVTNAHAARLIKKSQGFGAWTVYKTGAYRSYLGSAQKASSAPKITVYKPTTTGGFVALGESSGSLSEAQQIAQSMGLQLTSHVRPGDRGYHGSGRAMDFQTVGAPGNKGTPSQMQFAQAMISRYGKSLKQLIYTPLGFGIANGKQVGLDYWGESTNNIHYDHVHVAFEKGGKVGGLTRAILGEKGPEFVLDADTTAALEQNYPGFLSELNKADYKGALQVLQSYAEYYNPSKSSTLMIQRVIVEKPVPVPMGGGGGFVPLDSNSTSPSTAALSIG